MKTSSRVIGGRGAGGTEICETPNAIVYGAPLAVAFVSWIAARSVQTNPLVVAVAVAGRRVGARPRCCSPERRRRRQRRGRERQAGQQGDRETDESDPHVFSSVSDRAYPLSRAT